MQRLRWLSSFLIAGCLLVASQLPARSAEWTGKVLAVYHEPVNVNNVWMDKVSLTLAPCSAPNTLATAWYNPGTLSEENHLSFLYRNLANAARSVVMKNQYMNSVNGHVTVVVDDTDKHITKTTFWGYNWECGRDVNAPGASASSSASPGMPAGAAPAATKPPADTSAQPYRKSVPGVGIPGIGRFGF